MMLVEKIRRTLPPRCDPGRMVGCSDSPNPNQPLGQLLALIRHSFGMNNSTETRAARLETISES